MKIRQPLVLFLGGLLSASSVGCSAISAIVAEYQPGSREPRGSADRLVAIGRVFENQGRLDQAEVMYRRALKAKPSDPIIREQVDRLADARSGRRFESNSVESALAAADSVSPSRSTRRSTTQAASGRATLGATESNTNVQPVAMIEDAESLSVVAPEVADETVTADASIENTETLANVDSESDDSQSDVTVEQILAIIDAPNANADVLIAGLSSTSTEAQCLSATLLGECDSSDTTSAALSEAATTATDERFVLSLAASRNLRGEADATTSKQLLSLLGSFDSDTVVQATAELRCFAGTDAAADCTTALANLLNHTDARVRAVAAATLGDFRPIDEDTRLQLKTLATEDSNDDVRDAAANAFGSDVSSLDEELPELIVSPRT